jgi:hypothetical protein
MTCYHLRAAILLILALGASLACFTESQGECGSWCLNIRGGGKYRIGGFCDTCYKYLDNETDSWLCGKGSPGGGMCNDGSPTQISTPITGVIYRYHNWRQCSPVPACAATAGTWVQADSIATHWMGENMMDQDQNPHYECRAPTSSSK